MSPAGFESESRNDASGQSKGRNLASPGQNQGLNAIPLTESGAGRTQADSEKTHNPPTTDSTTDPDLAALVKVWPDLSRDSRRAIAEIVRTRINKGESK